MYCLPERLMHGSCVATMIDHGYDESLAWCSFMIKNHDKELQ